MPPPVRRIEFSLLIDKLILRVPQWVGLVVLLVLMPVGAWRFLGSGGGPAGAKRGAYTQEWTSDASLSSGTALAALPIQEGQITTASACRWPNQMRRGACWIHVGGAKPPCLPPDGNGAPLFEDDGKCWAPVYRAARQPTTGEPLPGNVAGGAE